jgi:hypothetical protein
MNRRSILNLSAVTALGLVVSLASAIAQQTSLKEQLVGTWAFVSSTGKLADGSPVWGTNPQGILTDANSEWDCALLSLAGSALAAFWGRRPDATWQAARWQARRREFACAGTAGNLFESWPSFTYLTTYVLRTAAIS